jgi:hypothetical protein
MMHKYDKPSLDIVMVYQNDVLFASEVQNFNKDWLQVIEESDF